MIKVYLGEAPTVKSGSFYEILTRWLMFIKKKIIKVKFKRWLKFI